MEKKGLLCFKKGEWFFESGDTVPFDETETKIGIKIKRKIVEKRSKHQKIQIFDACDFGKILVLDGILQTAEKSEFVYHEMLCHPPLFSFRSPKKVLIIGGGDGGSLEECLKHPIDKAVMVEIDEDVVNVCKKNLSSISKEAFKDGRSEIIIGDGKKYIRECREKFDAIIIDLSDPAGPARNLISLNFYKSLKNILREGGVVSVQSGSFFCQPKLVRTIWRRIAKVFSYVQIRKAVVPEYHAGEYAFITASEKSLEKIKMDEIKENLEKGFSDLKYYNPEIHFSSSILPKHLKNIL